MAIQVINTGSSANKGDGDSLRTAFHKINNNFAFLSTGTISSGYSGYSGYSGAQGSAGTSGYSGYSGATPSFSSVTEHIIPSADLTYDLGSTSSQWRSLYVGTSTIYLGGTALSIVDGNLTVGGSPVNSSGTGGTTSTLVNDVYTVSLSASGDLIIPNAILGSGDQALVIQNTASGAAYLELPVDPSTNSVIIANQAASSATVTIRVGDFGSERNWTFNEFGALEVPSIIYNNDTSNVGQLLLAGDAGESATYLALPSDVGSTTTNVRLANFNGNIQLYAGNNSWLFNDGGDIMLPKNGSITENIVTNELWGTTTTSLTLVPAGAANGTQRLEIYSTGGGEGDHIHITSGDQNVTDLYLGNDTQYFAVGAMGENEIRARRGANSPSPGTSAGSGSPVWIYAGNAGDNGGSTADGAPGGDVFLQAGIASDGLGGEIILVSGNGPTGHGSIKLSTNGGSSYLEFNNSGTLTFPSSGNITFDSSATSYINGVSGIEFANATTQTTAYTGIAAQGTTSTSAAVGYIGIPQNNQTSNYTVNITDQGKHIYCTGTSFTVTIPANTVTSFPNGSSVAFIAGPTTTATIAIQTDTMYLGGSGTTGTRTLSPFGMATAVKVDATTWFINGTGLE